MGELVNFLEGHAARGAYPFHMPGHKGAAHGWDITEIDGADNLREPEGALQALQARLARLYGAEAAYLSVNGSSAGVLAAVLAAAGDGDVIVAARNAHASFFGALALSGARPAYVMPEETPYGFAGAADAAGIDAALADNPGAKAVFVTSPTYEGVTGDISAIAEAAHGRGAILIVDAAHGAHFLYPPFPRNAVLQGADMAVHGLHKTLAAYTQTAALHVTAACAERAVRWLNVVQTSSPSYLLMAQAERCADELERHGGRLFAEYAARLAAFRAGAAGLENIKPIETGDPGKLVFAARDGRRLARVLDERYGIITEAAFEGHLIAMTSYKDTDAGFERLLAALGEIDKAWPPFEPTERTPPPAPALAMTPREAMNRPKRRVAAAEAVGRVSAELIAPYPPGLPVIAPGEAVTAEAARACGAGHIDIVE